MIMAATSTLMEPRTALDDAEAALSSLGCAGESSLHNLDEVIEQSKARLARLESLRQIMPDVIRASTPTQPAIDRIEEETDAVSPDPVVSESLPATAGKRNAEKKQPPVVPPTVAPPGVAESFRKIADALRTHGPKQAIELAKLAKVGIRGTQDSLKHYKDVLFVSERDGWHLTTLGTMVARGEASEQDAERTRIEIERKRSSYSSKSQKVAAAIAEEDDDDGD